MVTTYHPQGVRSSHFHDLNNIETFEQECDSIDATVSKINKFVVYVRAKDLVAGGADKHNDCLFFAIKQAYGHDTQAMPSKLRHGYQLKEMCQLKRDDKVPVSCLHYIEDQCKISFAVTESANDVTYVSKVIRPVHITLNLNQEHYTLRCNKNRSYWHGIFYIKERTQSQVISIKHIENAIRMYNGTSITEISDEETYDLFKENIVLKCNDDEELIDKWGRYIRDADLLLHETHGMINLYKYKSVGAGAMEIWRMLSKNFAEPDEITPEESIFIDRANHGGHHYNESYEGFAELYDINSMYLHYMSSNKFTFPIRWGEFHHMTQEQFDQKYKDMNNFSYGIYRCKVEDTGNKLFHPFKNCYYTHFDLNLCQELGIKFELIQDGQANMLLYPPQRAFGCNVFKAFKNFMYPLKQQGLPVKPYINALWGEMCNKCYSKAIGTGDNVVDISHPGDFIDTMYERDDKTIVKYANMNQIFNTEYAHIGCFLCGHARLQFMCMIKPFYDDIIRINSDSVMTKRSIKEDLDIGKELGQLKIEHSGEVDNTKLNRKPQWK